METNDQQRTNPVDLETMEELTERISEISEDYGTGSGLWVLKLEELKDLIQFQHPDCIRLITKVIETKKAF